MEYNRAMPNGGEGETSWRELKWFCGACKPFSGGRMSRNGWKGVAEPFGDGGCETVVLRDEREKLIERGRLQKSGFTVAGISKRVFPEV
jgi:hypothetical protein